VRVTQHRALGRLRKILLGESGARGIAAAERLRGDRGEGGCADAVLEVAETAPEPAADAPELEELDIDPDVAAADESVLGEMAAFFADVEPEAVVAATPAPRRPTPYKRSPGMSC
jgi:hypothetical protein